MIATTPTIQIGSHVSPIGVVAARIAHHDDERGLDAYEATRQIHNGQRFEVMAMNDGPYARIKPRHGGYHLIIQRADLELW